MRRVYLRGKPGRFALVDEEDYQRVVAAGPWYARPTPSTTYASIGPRRGCLYMHMVVTGEKGIDHINGVGLDNRRCNLRKATPQENTRNSRPQRDSSSRFKGVYRQKGRTRWMARIHFGGKDHFLGSFNTECEAAIAYDAAARKHFAKFAWLNFPDEARMQRKRRSEERPLRLEVA